MHVQYAWVCGGVEAPLLSLSFSPCTISYRAIEAKVRPLALSSHLRSPINTTIHTYAPLLVSVVCSLYVPMWLCVIQDPMWLKDNALGCKYTYRIRITYVHVRHPYTSTTFTLLH